MDIVKHDSEDEGTWWWEMSLPKDASLTDIEVRYNTLRDLRLMRKHPNWDDLTRLTAAYIEARRDRGEPRS